MTVSLEKTTQSAGKVKVIGTVNLTQTRKTAMRAVRSAIRNNVPGSLVLGKKRADFHELNDCLVFLRDNCKTHCAIDVQKRAIAKLIGAPFSARANGCLDALKNHHKWRVINVTQLEG